MSLDDIPAVRLLNLGVSFRYLVFRLTSGQKETLLVRGLNSRPYETGIEQRIINQTREELAEFGFQEDHDELATNGGGTARLNPYNESITLFGASPERDPEENRDEVHELFQQAFPQHSVDWFSEGHAAEVEQKQREAKAKAKAAKAAAKAKKAAAEKAVAAKAEPNSVEADVGSEAAED